MASHLNLDDFERDFRSSLERLDAKVPPVTRRSDRPSDQVEDSSAEWTNVLLNIVCDLGHEKGYTVWPRRRYFTRDEGNTGGRNSVYDRHTRPGQRKPVRRSDDRGEYLLDACWTTYPDTDAAWLANPSPPEPRIVLACECEWTASVRGRLSADQHMVSILNDFAKLTDISAPLNVMIFGFTAQLAFDKVVEHCRKAAGRIGPEKSYLLLGWPQDACWGSGGRVSRLDYCKAKLASGE